MVTLLNDKSLFNHRRKNNVLQKLFYYFSLGFVFIVLIDVLIDLPSEAFKYHVQIRKGYAYLSISLRIYVHKYLCARRSDF